MAKAFLVSDHPTLLKRLEADLGDLGVDADVFILTTHDLTELSARLKHLVSRTAKTSPSQRIVIGSLLIDFESFEVSVGDQVVPLTFREYELLRFLAGNRGHVFTRKELVESIWNYDYLSGTRTVDVHIRRLRSKLGAHCGSMIETVRNVGYRFSRHNLP